MTAKLSLKSAILNERHFKFCANLTKFELVHSAILSMATSAVLLKIVLTNIKFEMAKTALFFNLC